MADNHRPEVTGRDGYIIAKALAYAIEAIAALPSEWQERGDQQDMRRLLDHLVGDPANVAMLQGDVHRHLRRGE